MTIYFAGSEPEALIYEQGSKNASTAYIDSNYSRASSRLSTTDRIRINLNASLSNLWLSVTMGKNTSYINEGAFFTFVDGANQPVLRFVHYSPSKYFTLRLEKWGGSAWVDAGGPDVVYDNRDLGQHILNLRLGASGGFDYWLDGLLIASASLDLSGIPNMQSIVFESPDLNIFLSQFIVADESLLSANVLSLPPTGNGSDTDGEGAITNINSANYDDTKFVSLNAAGDKRSYVMGARNLTRSVRAVAANARIGRVDSSGPLNVRPYLLISGTRYYGPTMPVPLGFAPFSYVWDNNPATSAPWDLATVNSAALETGWEAVA